MSAGEPAAGGPAPLLVVVDMQRVFAEPGSGWATPGFDEIVEPIAALADAFGNRVALTRFVVPAEPRGSWVDYYRDWEFVTRPGAAPLLDLVEPFASLAATGAPVVSAPTFSKWGAELDRLAGPAMTLVVCGVATDACVLATVLGALDVGMHVRVVEDACRGVNDEMHRAAVAVMANFPPQVLVTSVEEELRAAAARG